MGIGCIEGRDGWLYYGTRAHKTLILRGGDFFLGLDCFFGLDRLVGWLRISFGSGFWMDGGWVAGVLADGMDGDETIFLVYMLYPVYDQIFCL